MQHYMKTLYLQRHCTVKPKAKYGQKNEGEVEEVLQEATKMTQEVNTVSATALLK